MMAVERKLSPGLPELPRIEPHYLPDGGRPEVNLRRAPLLIIKDSEINRQIREFPRLYGTEVRFGLDGTIYYPTWRERVRVLKPDIYSSLSKLPQDWTTERMLVTIRRRPIVEMVYYQIRKEGGSVEAAIRSVGHVLRKYTVKRGEEVVELALIRGQITQALEVLTQFPSRECPEEFEQAFDDLHERTVEILRKLGMERKTKQVKKQLAVQTAKGTRGKDRLGRRNPQAMLMTLDSALAKAEMRETTINFIRTKFTAMRVALTDERRRSRGIFGEVSKEMSLRGLAGHGVFRYPERGTTPRQVGILKGKIGITIRELNLIKLKPYEPVAEEAIKQLTEAQKLIGEGRYQEAGEIFTGVRPKVDEVLIRYRRIYPKEEKK